MHTKKLLEREGDTKARGKVDTIVNTIVDKVLSGEGKFAGRTFVIKLKDPKAVIRVGFSKSENYAEVRTGSALRMFFNLSLIFNLIGVSIPKGTDGLGRLIRRVFKNPTFRSLVAHEVYHAVLNNPPDDNYSDDYFEYINHKEEVSAWFNQAVYAITKKAIGSKTPQKVIGRDAREFSHRIIQYLSDFGHWSNFSEDNKERILKRAYSGYTDVESEVLRSV